MSAPVVVYLLRHYPQLSQTFVRNEVIALRQHGVDVRVFSLNQPDLSVVDRSWGGPSSVVRHVSRPRAVADLAWWVVHHPYRLVRYARMVRRIEGLPVGIRWRSLPSLARGLAHERVTAVHTHFAWSTLPATPLLATLLGVPASATVHARDIYVPEPQAASWLAELDRLVTVCRYNVDRLHRDGLWDGPVDVVPCGVEVPSEPPPLDTAAHRIVTVGRLVPKKGVLTLVKAFQLVHQQVPDATLDIIGDGLLRPQLEVAIAAAGLEDHVRLLGPRTHDECLAAIDGASVFALACEIDTDGDSDALPVVLREAMARARPVVTTAVAGIPEVIDESTGWVVAQRDPEVLARALVEALTDTSESCRRGRAAHERTRSEGAVSGTAAAMKKVLGLGVPRIHLLGVVSLNGGDSAILDAQVQVLQRRWPDVRITVHERDVKAAARYAPRHRFVPFLGEQVEHPPGALSFRGARRLRRTTALLRASLARQAPWLRLLLPSVLRDVDLAVYTGGTSLTENYSLAEKLWELELLRRAGIPYAFFPQSAGPFNDATNRALLAPVLAGAALVMLRDRRSLSHVLDAGALPGRCVVVPDVVFALARVDSTVAQGSDERPERVAVSVREWPYFTTCSPAEGRARTITAFRQLVSTLVRERGAQVTFVSTCQGRPEYTHDDSVFAREIVTGLDDNVRPSVEVDGAPYPTEALIDRLAEFDAMVSMRLHAAILAVCSGVPTLAVAYEYKSTEVWSQLGQDEFTLDLETLDGAELASVAASLLDRCARTRADLTLRVASLRYDALRLGDALPDVPVASNFHTRARRRALDVRSSKRGSSQMRV